LSDTDAVSAAALAGSTATHCPYCSLQCGILMVAGSRPATLLPQEDFPTNRGGLCSKGWTAAELLDHKDRRAMLETCGSADASVSPVRSGGEDVPSR
jgi:assimilatory nitrate reductase catalytic subunit